jgi:hypothetical protein
MKKSTVLSILTVFFLFQIVFSAEPDQIENINWESMSKKVVQGLASEDISLRTECLQQIITFGDKLDVDDAVFNLVSIYRNSKNEKLRQFAVVALHKINNRWAMDYLKDNLKFENNPTIKRQILASIYQHHQEQLLANKKNNNEKSNHLLAETH